MKRRATFLAIACIALGAGCAPGDSSERRGQPVEVVLRAGTPVRLVLMTKAESGVELEGTPLLLIVEEDVLVDGTVAIRRGAVATGRVTQSRKGDLLRMIANQPSRLAIAFDSASAADGKAVGLTTPGDELKIERSMVGGEQSASAIEHLAADPETRKRLEALAGSIEKGRLDLSGFTREDLRALADDLRLTATKTLLDSNDRDSLDRALRQLAVGGAMIDAPVTAIAAALELIGVAGRAKDRLFGALKAPNIRAQIGTPLRAYVREDVVVRVD